MGKKKKVAVVGASGLVGRTVLKVLEENNFPDVSYIFFSSKKSAGNTITFLNNKYFIYELKDNSFDIDFDFAIFCAGGEISKKFIPIAVDNGCTVIDNSSVYRMDSSVPLVVPEINIEKAKENNGIIANPNCSTIQAVVPLKPLDDNFTIKRIVYSTYQAVSGAGKLAIEDLIEKNDDAHLKKFPYPIYNNCLPQIDVFCDDGYTKEEYKMINETRKILDKPNLSITATAVRVPVENCHCESINVEFEKAFNICDIKTILKKAPGVKVIDDIDNLKYPLPTKASGKDDVFVGRIRRDFSVKNGLNLWVVADNLRKGAASNAVQILEFLLKN